MVLRNVIDAVAAGILVASLTSTAADASLSNATLQWQYYAYGGSYSSGNSFKANGKIGGEFTAGTIQYFYIKATGYSITFDYKPASEPGTWSPSALSLAPTIYNGIAINLVSPGKIRSVTIDPQTNMKGFGRSRISFTDHQVQVDWVGLSYTNKTIVKLLVTATQGAGFEQAAPKQAAAKSLVPSQPANQKRAPGSTPP